MCVKRCPSDQQKAYRCYQYFQCDRQKVHPIPVQVFIFCRCLQILSRSCFPDGHVRNIPWVSKTFHLACQVINTSTIHPNLIQHPGNVLIIGCRCSNVGLNRSEMYRMVLVKGCLHHCQCSGFSITVICNLYRDIKLTCF